MRPLVWAPPPPLQSPRQAWMRLTTPPIQIGYLWKTNGIALANGNKYQGVTNVTLTVSSTTAKPDASWLPIPGRSLTSPRTWLPTCSEIATPQELDPAYHSTLTVVAALHQCDGPPPAQVSSNVWGSSANNLHGKCWLWNGPVRLCLETWRNGAGWQAPRAQGTNILCGS